MKGIAASQGIAIGKILKINKTKIDIVKRKINNYDEEVKKLEKARKKSIDQIDKLISNVSLDMGKEEKDIFEAHLTLVKDNYFFSEVEKKIKSQSINAEWALKEMTKEYIDMLSSMEDGYISERAVDIKDITDRIISNMMGKEFSISINIHEKVIIAADELTPSDIAQMNVEKVLGFLTQTGSKTSHVAIMARTLGIPALVGVDGLLEQANNNDIAIIDGEKGIAIINPSKEEKKFYDQRQKEIENENEELKGLIGKKTVTKDGFKAELSANAGTLKDVEIALKCDAEGIGLLRTEFLFMDRKVMPTEEEQFEWYKDVLQRMNGKPVIIRTLDAGGDKEISYLHIPREDNPFLGYRAIRICLDQKDIFIAQLRALLRSSKYGKLKIMFPMISCVEELREVKRTLEQVKDDLIKEGAEVSDNIEIGIMIEIPSAALISDILAKEVDFFSIGTNDLIQYCMAVDRGNQKISNLYTAFHPAVLKLIKLVIDNAHKRNIWVGMCGEAAGDNTLIPVLLGMGLDEFSMSPTGILKARQIIRSLNYSDVKNIAENVISLSTAGEIERTLTSK